MICLCVCVWFLVLLGIIISQPNVSETSAHQCGLLCKTLRTRNVRRKLLMRKPKEKPCFYLLWSLYFISTSRVLNVLVFLFGLYLGTVC
jgi:hypothetical protein